VEGKVKRSAAASLLAVALLLVAATPSHGSGGRVFIGGPVFWWGPYGGYYPQPYVDWAEVAEKREMAQVRLTTEAALISGCTRIGVVRDDDVKDLRRKIVRAGGNAAVLEFGVDDLSTVQAEVYRCTSTAKAPSNIPPPPAGAPPPPPPAGPAR
jgi:hypothetical protein